MGSSDVSSAVFTPPIGSSTSEPEAVSANEPLSVDESLLELVQNAYKHRENCRGFKSSELNYLDLKQKSKTVKDRDFCCCIC